MTSTSSMKSYFILLFAFSLFIQTSLCEVICEKLPENLCSFAVASSGKRCVLEKFNDETLKYTRTTSEVAAERFSGHVESDRCFAACGVDRLVVGISSDALMTAEFIGSLCSPPCYDNCSNIVDLYLDLAAGEGVFLPSLCEKQRSNPHRAMFELRSIGGAAPATVDDFLAPIPAPTPSGI